MAEHLVQKVEPLEVEERIEQPMEQFQLEQLEAME